MNQQAKIEARRKQLATERTNALLAQQFCECDNTHKQNGTMCQFCYVRAVPDNAQAKNMLVEHVAISSL
jgi:hypothetical protein